MIDNKVVCLVFMTFLSCLLSLTLGSVVCFQTTNKALGNAGQHLWRTARAGGTTLGWISLQAVSLYSLSINRPHARTRTPVISMT